MPARVRPSTPAAARKRAKRTTDTPDAPDDFVPPNRRAPKRVTWGYVKRLYRAEFPIDTEQEDS